MKWEGALLFCFLLTGWLLADDPPSYEANPELISIDGYVLIYDVQGPDSYVTLTTHDLPPNSVKLGEVHSAACQYGLSLPFTIGLKGGGKTGGALGKGGYEKALTQIKKQHPDIQGIYNVAVDMHTISILSIFTRECTEITASAFQ